jgi:hypothetical protein
MSAAGTTDFRWGRIMRATVLFTIAVTALLFSADFYGSDVTLPASVLWGIAVAIWMGFALVLVRMSARSFGVVSYWSLRGVMLMSMACVVGAVALFMALLLWMTATARLGGKL